MNDRDPLLSRRRRRQLPPLLLLALVLGGIGGLAALWIWVFSPIFITPHEFHQRQSAFNRALREVLRAQGDGASNLPPWPGRLDVDRLRVTTCAEAAVVRAVRYVPSRRKIPYPWGDVPDTIGTSADLMVRCLRAVNLDLQQMVAIDRKADRRRYPLDLLQNRRQDHSMDHRRVSFLFTFAKAFMPEAPLDLHTPEEMATFLPGDFVFWGQGGRNGYPGLLGIVLDRRDDSGMPLAATLLPGEGRTSGAHRLDEWPLHGHFDLDVDKALERFLETYPEAALQGRPDPERPE